MSGRRLLRGSAYNAGAQKRQRRLPALLLVIITLSIGLLVYNISSWGDLPYILARISRAVSEYRPQDHTILGEPTGLLPPRPLEANRRLIVHQEAASSRESLKAANEDVVSPVQVAVPQAIEESPPPPPLAPSPSPPSPPPPPPPKKALRAYPRPDTAHGTTGAPDALFFAPPAVRQFPDVFHDRNPTCKPHATKDGAPTPAEGGPRPLSWIVKKEDSNWPANCDGREELCQVVSRIHRNRAVMVAVANSHAPGLQGFLDAINALKIRNFMVVAIDERLATMLKQQDIPYYFKFNKAQGNHGVSAQKFGIIRDFVEIGCSVLLSDTDVVYLQNPFDFLYGDSDIESMSDGWDNHTVNGFLDMVDDPSLGVDNPARRKQTLRVAALNSGLWYVSASRASLHLMTIMQHRMATEDVWDQSAYNMELWQPSRDAHFTGGCTVRVMSPLCFVNSKVMFRYIRHMPYLDKHHHLPVAVHANYHTDKPSKMRQVADYYLQGKEDALKRCNGDGCSYPMSSCGELESKHLHSINDGLISSHDWRTSKPILRDGCKVEAPWAGKLGKLEHSLNYIRESREAHCASLEGEAETALCDVLLKLAPTSGEVLLIVADDSALPSLTVLMESIKSARITNALIAALDDEVMEFATKGGFSTWAAPADLSPIQCLAEAKWRTVGGVLRLGYSVLVVDPETVFFRNPFNALYKDSDVEVATEGFDDTTAYGIDHVVDDPAMGWSRYVHGFRSYNRDPGLIFLLPTHQSLNVAVRMAARLSAPGHARCSEEVGMFNEELWLPSHGSYTSAGPITRVMNYLCFSNSKTVTRFIAADAALISIPPVAVRLSYHPRSPSCSTGILKMYKNVDKNELTGQCKWTSVVPSREECAAMRMPKGQGLQLSDHGHASHHAVKAPKWAWGGVVGFHFLLGGELRNPWGGGSWGVVRNDPSRLWAEFAGAIHIVQFENTPENPYAMFVSVRCGDGDIVVGRVIAS